MQKSFLWQGRGRWGHLDQTCSTCLSLVIYWIRGVSDLGGGGGQCYICIHHSKSNQTSKIYIILFCRMDTMFCNTISTVSKGSCVGFDSLKGGSKNDSRCLKDACLVMVVVMTMMIEMVWTIRGRSSAQWWLTRWVQNLMKSKSWRLAELEGIISPDVVLSFAYVQILVENRLMLVFET